MPLPRLCLFFDIENEAPCWLQDPQKLFTPGQKPFDVFFRFDAAVSLVPLIGVRRRGDDKVKRPPLEVAQHFAAIALQNVRHHHKRIIAAKVRPRQFLKLLGSFPSDFSSGAWA